MIVPNYVPEPLEVPGNVTQERYLLRVIYIRRVTVFHLAGLLLAAGLAYLPWPTVGYRLPIWLMAAALVALDIWRILTRGSAREAAVSAWFLPIPVGLLAWIGHEAVRMGWPIAAPLTGVVCATLYTLLCGRDFSFVGCTLLAQIASGVVLAAIIDHNNYDLHTAIPAFVMNAGYLLYFEYDLASLLARRRIGEEWAAVVDLYRDVFNIFGYLLRVWRHWRKYRIWEAGK